MGFILSTLAATILAMTAGQANAAGDSCQSQLPSSLKGALAKSFPGFRSPLVSDNFAGDVAREIQQDGNGCFGVATADFDGDGVKDFIVALTAKTGHEGLVVVAFAKGRRWIVEKISKKWEDRSRLYVASDKPGRYDRTEALDGPLEPGEVDSLICPHSVAVLGAIESTGVAYCYQGGKWQHVGISD